MINYYSQRHQKNTESGKGKGWSHSPEQQLWWCRRWITFLKVKLILLWVQKLVDEALQPIPTPNGKVQGLSPWFMVWARKGSGPGGVEGVQADARFEWQMLHQCKTSFHSWLHSRRGLKDYSLKRLTFPTSPARKLEVKLKVRRYMVR